MSNHASITSRRLAALALLACSLLFAASAEADPAGRIGRIAWLSGSDGVTLYNADSGESYAAPLNQPLTSGDILTTATGARAEVQIGSMTVRLDGNSELELAQIDDQQVRLVLNNGRVITKLPVRDAVDDFALDTPDGQFTARDTGIYRFDTDDKSSLATPYYGTLHFSSRDNALDINAGQSAQFWYDGQTRSRLLNIVNDEFTQWSANRDRRPPANTYTRYVSPEMTGAEDLDAWGNWSDNSEYGAIWVPRHVDPDWAPYRTGRWVWVAPWGWNWVGNEPWGFAPFHYGRWVQYRGAWGWVPGARVVRPVYSPAMVAWIGSPGLNISISIGSRPNVGWFPLAPHEVYVPSYHTSATYIRNVNITHVTHITNVERIVSNPQAVIQETHYHHRDMPRAVTVVPTEVVTHRRPVESSVLPSDEHRGQHDQRDVLRPALAPTFTPVAGASPRPQGDTHVRPERSGFRTGFSPDSRDETPVPRRDRDAQEPPRVDSHNASFSPQSPLVTPSRNERPDVRTPADVSPPAQVDTRNPPLRPEQPSPRRERDPRDNAVTPLVPQTPILPPQRGERPTPEVLRPAPRPAQPEERPDVRTQAPVPVQVETQNPGGHPEQPSPRPPRRERDVQENLPTPSPAPQMPAVMPQRVERPAPEVLRPAPRPVQPEMHVAPPPQNQAPARMEAPVAHEQRHDAPPREANRPTREEEELLKRRRRNEEDKH